MKRNNIKEVSLVLGSGGARGLAHIGVIRALEAHGWEIATISGSSMGALIGGIYAAGKLDDYEKWVRELTEFNVLRFLDLGWGKAGLFKGDMLMKTLKGFIGDHRIEEMPIPLTLVATDVLTRQEVWLSRGDLFDAIRASIAVPTIFAPHPIKGRKLLDGGILNPVPIAPTLRDPTDAIVAVSLSGEPRGPHRRSQHPETVSDADTRSRYRDKIDAFIDRMQQILGLEPGSDQDRERLSITDAGLLSLDAMQASIARCKLAAYPPDLLIEIPIDTCAAHEFYRAQDAIEAGEYWAEKAIQTFVTGHDH